MGKNNTSKKAQKKWLQVLQFFAAYLVAAWTFLQFVDWILIRYSISPYWVDMFLWLFVGIIPSMIIYLYHRERINQRVLRLREKIIFPLNIVIIAIGLYFGFGTSDLGATTKEIEITNNEGEIENITITKEEFRTILPIFNFTPISKDSSIAWLGHGIRNILFYDLSQDKSLTVETQSESNTTAKVTEAKLNSQTYIDGSFDKQEDTYIINVSVRSSKNGKVKNDKIFSGTDLLNLIDEISVYIKQETVVSLENSSQYLDLEIKEHLSESLPAIKYFVAGDYERAIELDSTFALAYLNNSINQITYNRSRIDAKQLADKAFEHKNRLTYDFQKQVVLYRYLAYEQWEAAEDLLKLQLEDLPQNRSLNTILYRLYSKTRNTQAFADHAEKQHSNLKSAYNRNLLYHAGLISGRYNELIEGIKLYMRLNPFNDGIFPYLLAPQLLKGDLNEAQATLDKIKLLHPNDNGAMQVYESTLAYLKNNKVNIKDLNFFKGEFRAHYNQSVQNFWIEDNRLLGYYSNQFIQPYIPVGDSKLMQVRTPSLYFQFFDFIENEKGQVYQVNMVEKDPDTTRTYLMWKLDASIKKAEQILLERNYDEAEEAYKEAIEANPKHFYLKDALQHIEYVKNTDSVTLQKQYEQVVGTYSKEETSKRKIRLKNGRLLYKRGGLSSKELLPISATRYMNMSEFRYNYEFEYKDGQVLASFAWFFNPENMAWEKYAPENNYMLKDQ
ncbi:MAG: hypothetical protein KJN65_11905 [Croceitalea sp.]|nr:hypothetical protein [Croceitalea sp.]